MKRKKAPPRFVQVNTRLFAEDVAALRASAAAAGESNWQPRLRVLVHAALRTKGVVK